MINKHIQKNILIGIVLVLISIISLAPVAQAVFGRANFYGYFTDQYDMYGDNVLPAVNPTGLAIPNYINNVSSFVSLLQGYNISGNSQKKTGSAFIVNTILGRNAPGNGRTVSAADWNDLTARLNNREANGKIRWSGNVSSDCISSIYQGTGKGTNPNDDTFFTNSKSCTSESGIAILNDSGSEVYKILRRCANPVGSMPGVPVANNWTLSATSTANVATAKPGDVIQWTHKLTNDGPDATSANVESNLGMSGFSNGWSTGLADSINAAGAAKGLMRTIANYAAYTVTQADVGNTLCEWVQYSPTDSKGNIDGRATHACVTIPYVYTLTPTLTTDVSGAIESGTTVNATPKVANSGPTRSDNTNWQLTQTIVLPGKSIPNVDGGTSALSNTPCNTYFQSLPNATCSVVNSGTSVFEAITGNVLSGTPLSTSAVPVGDLAVGTKVCFAFSIQPRASDSTEWRHSAPVCLIIGKKPKTQVLGSDLSVGRGFSSIVGSTPTTASVITSSTLKNIAGTPRMFGSWIEYGIFATGVIKGAGSGSAYADSGMDNYSACRAGRLSFVNTNVGDSNCNGSTVIGNFSTAQSIPDASTSFPVSISTPTLGGTISLNGLSGLYKGTGADITINASSIAKGQWVVINAPNSNVMIAGNINYTNEKVQSIYDIPQLVIIGKNITINDNVTNVDAWLVARGTNNAQGVLATCSSVPPLTASMCKDPLIVNGPIMAQKLVLLRTAGSGTGASSGDPAETFNLRPDAYLWSFARASAGGHIQTVYSQELPPRF